VAIIINLSHKPGASAAARRSFAAASGPRPEAKRFELSRGRIAGISDYVRCITDAGRNQDKGENCPPGITRLVRNREQDSRDQELHECSDMPRRQQKERDRRDEKAGDRQKVEERGQIRLDRPQSTNWPTGLDRVTGNHNVALTTASPTVGAAQKKTAPR
jgi:hypothetical protein